jgi:hypothetical protein
MCIPFYFLLFFIFGHTQQQNTNACGCIPTKVQDPDESYRYEAKHVKSISQYPEHIGTINSETVRSWEKIYRSKAIHIFEESKRMDNTPEDSLYTLTGYIYSAKINEHDCDLHLEIGTGDPNTLRTVAEIPKDSCNLQDRVIQQLKEKGFVLGEQNRTGVKCTLKGLGFYDGKHPEKLNKKHEKGTPWEIHPVTKIELL